MCVDMLWVVNKPKIRCKTQQSNPKDVLQIPPKTLIFGKNPVVSLFDPNFNTMPNETADFQYTSLCLDPQVWRTASEGL